MQTAFVLAVLSAAASAAPPAPELIREHRHGSAKYVLEPPDILILDVTSTAAPAGEVALQELRGVLLLRPDGTLSLRRYGAVHVAGLTLANAKAAIERHLSGQGVSAKISLDVFAYNSKFCYVIVNKGGPEEVFRYLLCENETVLAALAQVPGLPARASRMTIRLIRGEQALDVDWQGIVQRGSMKTNYELRAGDRIHASQPSPGSNGFGFTPER